MNNERRARTGATRYAVPVNPKSKIRNPKSRSAFTLIELLVAISIIGILAALALGGMYRANLSANRVNSRATVNKVGAQVQEIWESYRTRRLPIDPRQMLLSGGSVPYTYQYSNAVNWLTYYATIRSNVYPVTPEPLAQAPGTPGFPNNIQVAAIKLAATRELMRLELPCQFSDFTSSPSGTTPSNAAPIQALLIPQPMNGTVPLANPGGLSEQYRQFFMQNATTYNDQYQSAECLYMILKFASQNELGQRSIANDPRLVGDIDGDGMPEVQDAFNASIYSPAPAGSPYSQHHMPISFIRWPVGFISEMQPGPPLTSQTGWTPTVEYAAARHDIFDPLRVDPRAFTLTPLVYSAGAPSVAVSPYSDYDIWEGHSYANAGATKALAQFDPYYTDKYTTPIFPVSQNTVDPLPGTQMDPGVTWPGGQVSTGAYADNITNHLLSTRAE
jgi:prepilin-type N-terminal cleavage/methylation domain-containing protein